MLTASGGPFRGWNTGALEGVRPSDALRHPTWEMGAKITVDSATLANKALEVIEAHFLYGIPYSAIDVVVHVHLETTPLPDGTPQRHRWVAEIITVTGGEREKGYAIQHVFRTHPGEREATAHVLDDSYRDLAGYGFDLNGFYADATGAAP